MLFFLFDFFTLIYLRQARNTRGPQNAAHRDRHHHQQVGQDHWQCECENRTQKWILQVLTNTPTTQGKHIVNIFKEAKAAYQEKKAAIKAERAATAACAAATDGRHAVRRAHTYDARSRAPEEEHYYYDDPHVYDLPERRHFLPIEQQTYYTHEPYLYQEPQDIADTTTTHQPDGRRRSVDDDGRSHASSRRSHATHRSRRSRATATDVTTTTTRHGAPRPALTATNLRTLTEVSATTPSQVPRAYRSAYAETATQQQQQQQQYDNMTVGRPLPVHAHTTPPSAVMNRTTSAPNLQLPLSTASGSKKKKEIDMNLAYGNVPPDLATRTDLGPVTRAEEHEARLQEEARREQEARTLMARIDQLLDEAECVQHSATSIIDHLQRQPEAAAAVALMLAELSTLLKAMSPSFLGVVKGGFPAVFALLASPQFLIGVGVAVGVTVVFFGGWKIVKRVKEARAIAAERTQPMAFEGMQSQYQAVPPAMAPSEYQQQQQQPPYGDGNHMYGAGGGPGSFDDALVLDEELSSIETWRRGIAPSDQGDEELESVDLELITPEAVRSVRGGDARSIRTTRTHRSSKSHRSSGSSRRHHHHHHDNDEEQEEERTVVDSARSHKSSSRVPSLAARAESVAGTERSHRTSRSKMTTTTTTSRSAARTTELRAIEDGSRAEDNTLASVLSGNNNSNSSINSSGRKSNMLKTLFKKKKDREDAAVSVMA